MDLAFGFESLMPKFCFTMRSLTPLSKKRVQARSPRVCFCIAPCGVHLFSPLSTNGNKELSRKEKATFVMKLSLLLSAKGKTFGFQMQFLFAKDSEHYIRIRKTWSAILEK
ncbi:uncharacterized protein ACIBXB_013269 isoform 1-T1 [Morphnus guianensis]